MKKYNLILTILILTILTLVATRVVLENSMSTSGIALSKLNSQIQLFRLENEILEESYFSKTSLTYLATEAAKLGFTYNKNNLVLTSPLPLAKR